MSEWHVEVVQLGAVGKHPNADSLSITQIHGGYPVIFRTGEFKEGDLAVYVPVDSVMPDTEQFHFLAPKPKIGLNGVVTDPGYPVGHVPAKYRRIKAKKIRGIFSQGMLIPALSGMTPGQLVHEAIGITKYEEPEEQVFSARGQVEKGPSGWEFIKYTDIEGLRRYQNVLQVGEEVVITEKVHGCLTHDMKVTMSDGSKKKIKDIVVGDEVLGVDLATSRTGPTKVTNVWKNGKAEKWLRIQTTRKHIKSGNAFIRIISTPEHKFFVKQLNKFLPASELRSGDTVLIHRKDSILPEFQKQVLTGMLLGDASSGGKNPSWSVSWGHTHKDEGYMSWIAKALGDIYDPRGEGERVSGFGSKILLGRSIWSPSIRNAFECFYDENGRKQVPDNIKDFLTPVSLAFWFMDDGSCANTHNSQLERPGIATCSFTVDECHKLQQALLEKFGIFAKITSRDYPRMHFDAEEAEKLFLLIAPYVPKCMQRKLPERFRGHDGWLPSLKGQEFFTQLVEQTITSIEDVTDSIKSERYDLETETHNYFAQEILVHNSNARFCWDGDRLWCGSRAEIKKEDVSVNWWHVAQKLNLAERLVMFPKTIIFGEIYGAGIQKLTYDRLEKDFIIFDSFDVNAGIWNNWDKTVAIAQQIGLPTVPVLYRGPWQGVAAHAELANGKSTFANHIKEGFVVKPATERWNDRVGRVIFKLIGEEYLLQK